MGGLAEPQGRNIQWSVILQGETLQVAMALRTTGQAACLVKMGREGHGRERADITELRMVSIWKPAPMAGIASSPSLACARHFTEFRNLLSSIYPRVTFTTW